MRTSYQNVLLTAHLGDQRASRVEWLTPSMEGRLPLLELMETPAPPKLKSSL